jgi:hypothetical protein
VLDVSHQEWDNVSPDQAKARIMRQKFSGWNEGSLSASTSALTVPKLVSGLCRIPSQKAWIISSLKWPERG